MAAQQLAMGHFARRISEVASWTMASRILGLVRDVLLFAALGTGAMNSAFILAFTLPNLFRRLFGEGALTSSSIPVLSGSLERNGRADTFDLFNAITGRLGVALLLLQIPAIPAFLLVALVEDLPERWHVAARLSQILFPYMLFICLGALVCGMLNVLGRFGLAAMNQVWLNLAMIAGMLLGIWLWPDDSWAKVVLISVAVLVGGLLQLAIPAAGLVRQGWSPRPHLRPHPGLGKVLRLFLPSLLGAAIFQINIVVSRFLAFSLDDTSTALLYLAGRLVELPLGVFAIAVTTVIFPELSRLIASGREDAYARTFSRGMGLIFMITLPATLGLILLARPILGFLFQWGLFDSRDVDAAVPVLVASVLGMPFFAWSTLLTRSWYARQEMRTPVRLAALNLFLNLLLGLSLMQFWGAVGLALANTFSALIHCLALQYFLPGKGLLRVRLRTVASLGAGLLALAGIALAGSAGVDLLPLSGKLRDLIAIAAVIPLAACGYFAVLWLSGHPGLGKRSARGA